jgi:hypothetical protein
VAQARPTMSKQVEQDAASFEPVFAAGRCACAAPDPLLCSGFQCSVWQTDSGFQEQCKKRIGGPHLRCRACLIPEAQVVFGRRQPQIALRPTQL